MKYPTKYLSCVVILAFASVALAEVDNSSPDLSKFQLRHVGNGKQFAKQRATNSIRDLGAAANQLHYSLHSSDSATRCGAYGQLFRMIKAGAEVHQDTIEALALVANDDSRLFGALLKRDPKYEQETSNFIEAIESLGLMSGESWDVYLELVRCAGRYLGGCSEKLNAPLNRFISFNNILATAEDRAEISNSLIEGRAKQGMIDAGVFSRWGDSNVAVVDEARKIIFKTDTDEIKAFKREVQSGAIKLVDLDPDCPIEEMKKYHDKKMEENHHEETDKGEAILFSVDDVDEHMTQSDNEFSSSQLMVLKMLKMRILNLEKPSVRYERQVPISMSAAIDFTGNWLLLNEAELNPKTLVGAQAIAFRDDADNKKIAKLVGESIETYGQIAKMVEELKELQSVKGKMTEVSQMHDAYHKLRSLLDQMNPIFDVDSVRRMADKWGAKLTEYQTMDKFINMDSW